SQSPSNPSSPSQNSSPVNPATLSPACGTDPASAGLSKNPQPNPHPKPLTLNRLPAIPPQPRHFFVSSKADPASPGPTTRPTSPLKFPPRKNPHPLAIAH